MPYSIPSRVVVVVVVEPNVLTGSETRALQGTLPGCSKAVAAVSKIKTSNQVGAKAQASPTASRRARAGSC